MMRPSQNQELYHDGHNHEHNFGFMLGCDGVEGACRVFNGHCPGSHNDLNIYYNSDLYHNPGIYLGPGDKMAADGIFARINVEDDVFVVPVCGVRRELTEREKNYNYAQRHARSIIEHYNGRLKGSCGILTKDSFFIGMINTHFIASLCLTNIRVKYQDRLRNWD